MICKNKSSLCNVPVPLMQACPHCNNQEPCLWVKRFYKIKGPGFEDKCFLHLLFFALTPIWTTWPECGKTSLLKFHPQGNRRWLFKGGLQGLSTVSWGLVETSKQWVIPANIHGHMYTTDGFLEFCRQWILWTGNPNAWRVIQKTKGFQILNFQRGKARVQKHKWTDNTAQTLKSRIQNKHRWIRHDFHSFSEENR